MGLCVNLRILLYLAFRKTTLVHYEESIDKVWLKVREPVIKFDVFQVWIDGGCNRQMTTGTLAIEQIWEIKKREASRIPSR